MYKLILVVDGHESDYRINIPADDVIEEAENAVERFGGFDLGQLPIQTATMYKFTDRDGRAAHITWRRME